MKFPFTLVPFALAALVCGCASSTTSSDLDPAERQKIMMEKWMEFMTPGPEHKLLDSKVGRWDARVRMWEPGSPMTESTGRSDIKWIMDGRYLEDHTDGMFDTMPFQGLGHVGFDKLKHKYVSTWLDSMGTGVMIGEGTYDAATKTFTYASQSPNVMTGKYDKTRMTETLVDKDHWTMKMFGNGPDGKEMMMMQIDYTRAR